MQAHKDDTSFCLSLGNRGASTRWGAGILLALLALIAAPARAQIASYLDERGRRVYTNGDDLAPQSRRAAKPTEGAKQTAAAGQAVQQAADSDRRTRAQAIGRGTLDRLVQETAERHRVDPALVRAVVEAESNWNPWAVSHKGAQGLMQLVPGTAQRFGAADAFNPEQNVDAGVRYLRTLLERYGGDLNKSLAAYNAGEHAVDRVGGVPRFRETRHYVQKVTNTYFGSPSRDPSRAWNSSRPIYRTVDDRGRTLFTNE